MNEHSTKATESISCFCQEKLNLERLLSQLKEVLKDTDDQEAKDKVDVAIRKVSAACRILVVGAEETGRTSLLQYIFMDVPFILDSPLRMKTHGIEETRFGAAEVDITVNESLTRRFSVNPRLEGLVLTDIGEERFYNHSQAAVMAEDAQAILVVFSSENIQNPRVWEFIEQYCSFKKTVFILNKCDLYPPRIIEKKRTRLLDYMEKAGIHAPLFAVSLKEPKENSQIEELSHYLREEVFGKCLVKEKHARDISLTFSLVKELSNSFGRRCQQFEEDQKILLYIDEKLDHFYHCQKEQAEQLKSQVFSVIRQEIDNYRDCMIKKLDPRKLEDDMDIRDKNAFKEWLQHELEKRERILKQKVQAQIQKSMRWYYDDLAAVYEDVTRKLEGRKICMGLEDRFYGSLQNGKQEIVTQTLQIAQSSKEEFSTLAQATEDFYRKIKGEADRYRRMKQVSAMAGSFLSGAAAMAGGHAAGIASAGIASALLPVMGTLVIGTAGVYVGMKLFECFYEGHFEKNIEKHITEFCSNIEGIKETMVAQTGERMDQVFEEVLSQADKTFLLFRTTTNIDSRNIPLLEDKMQSMEQMFHDFTKSLEGAI